MEIEKNKNTLSENNSFLNSLNVSSVVEAECDLQSNFKRKRRSKNDPNGRMFKCECGKAYLSALALSNHSKSKHYSDSKIITENPMIRNFNLFNHLNNFDSTQLLNNDDIHRKRGRPKKKFDIMNDNPEINYQIFFQKDHRRKKENEMIEINSLIHKIFNEIYVKKKEIEKLNEDSICGIGRSINRGYDNIEEHLFFNFIINKNISSNASNVNHKKYYSSDEIFLKYLEQVSLLTNKEYFIFVFKFIVIFRDCINKYKNIELENSICILGEYVPIYIKEFTQYFDAEQIPELCNEFITDYLTEEYFHLKNEYLSDFVEIIQHFCHWLYENNFSSSRLLVNN